ncbi:MAG TPA: acyltransferase family protein [Spongiibacteraceae bacterium]|nr:acyltransferase family protein [Spongiibacteraceae bacterium]
MQGTILIANAVIQTWLIIAFLFAALALFTRRIDYGDLLPLGATQELKGIATFAVVFGHIGYFLVDDTRFLFPLSVGAGVGVNIFLFLSGYGLTLGMMKKPLAPVPFYRKRALKIFIPLWPVLIGFFALDALVLHRYYPATYIARSMLGFFPKADMPSDVNSVLWYITWTLFYYLLLPLVFMRRRAWLSALILFALGQGLVWWNPRAIELVTRLYEVHTVAFPLGVLVASVLFESREQNNPLAQKVRAFREQLTGAKYYAAIAVLLGLIVYSMYFDSGIGQSTTKEQVMSLVATLSFVLLFAIKRIEFKMLTLIGVYSYEIYLLHWPLVSRYDVIYAALPASIATFAYFVLFMGIGWLIMRVTKPVNAWMDSRA